MMMTRRERIEKEIDNAYHDKPFKRKILIAGLWVERSAEDLEALVRRTSWVTCVWYSPRSAALLCVAYFLVTGAVIFPTTTSLAVTLQQYDHQVIKDSRGRVLDVPAVEVEGIRPAKFMMSVLAVCALTSILATLMLMMGINQDKANYIYIWMIIHSPIVAIEFLICFVHMFLVMPYVLTKVTYYLVLMHGMASMYCMWVVNNFYHQEVDKIIPLGSFSGYRYYWCCNANKRDQPLQVLPASDIGNPPY